MKELRELFKDRLVFCPGCKKKVMLSTLQYNDGLKCNKCRGMK